MTKAVHCTEINHRITKKDSRLTYEWSSPITAESSVVSGFPVLDVDSIPVRIRDLLLSDDELITQYSLGTYFDRLAALVAGLITYEETISK